MKKFLYTAALVSLLGIMAKAQDTRKATDNGAKSTTTKDKSVANDQATIQSADHRSDNADKKEKGATRMAITEKGVPASKNTETTKSPKAAEPKKAEPAKTEKH
jgi:hypothetical protein